MKKLKLLLLLPLAFTFAGAIGFSVLSEPIVCIAAVNQTVQEEANAFVSYWKTSVRGMYPDICSMPKTLYDEVYLKYVSLSSGARNIVDSTIDVDNYTIKDSMNTLINKFSKQSKLPTTVSFDKSTTLTIIIVVGVFGMTAICGFYLLKTKNVIE